MTGHCLSGRRQLLVRATVYRTWYNDSTSWEPVGTTPTDTIRVPNAPTRYRIEKPRYRAVFVAHLPTNSLSAPVMLTALPFIRERSDAPNPETVASQASQMPRPASTASLTRPPLRWEIFSSIETRSQTRSTKRSSTLVATPSATTGISNSPMTGSRYRGKQRFASWSTRQGVPVRGRGMRVLRPRARRISRRRRLVVRGRGRRADDSKGASHRPGAGPPAIRARPPAGSLANLSVEPR